MKQFEFTMDQVLSEIRKIERVGQEGFTVAQMVEQTGYGANWCRAKLRVLMDTGQAVCCGKTTAETIDGRRCKIPVYGLVHTVTAED